MPWEDWIDRDTIKTCARHASGAVASVLIFLAIRYIVRFGVEEGLLRTVLETTDSFVLIGLFIWLPYQMGVILWNRRVKIEKALTFLAV